MGVTTQKYDILTRVAVGNGALVYRAVDKESNRQVALKLLVQEGDLDHRFNVDALLADSGKLTSITGAHVCQLLDAHTDEDGPVLIYEFANGISGTELPSTRKLEGAHALDVAAQLVSALRSGERQRCPHGDVKPSNIIFVDLPDGRLFTLVLDWGLTAYRTAVADDSLPFQAPERLTDAPASHRADLFSLGALLFYLYTGKLLVAGATREELLAGWQKARPSMLGEIRPDLPPKLVQWVCSLLELTPEKRPASAVDAATALVALNPPAPPVPPETIRPRSAQQRPPSSFGSGIAKPPTASSAPRPAPVPATSPSAAQLAKASRQPAKLSHVAMTLGLFLLFVALIAASVWFVFFRKKEPEFLTNTAAEESGKPVAARTPSPSVGSSIDRQFSPTPATIAAAKPKASSIPLATIATAAKPPPAANKPPSPLIAADVFDYPQQKPVNDVKGGAGWAGPWKGQLATVDGSSLEAKQFPARGGSLVIPPAQKEISLSRTVGPLNRFLADPKKGGTWYFGCLLQHGSNQPAPVGDIRINPFSASDVGSVVQIVASAVGGKVRLSLNNSKDFIEVPDPSKPFFLALQTTLSAQKANGKPDLVATLYVNPDIDAGWPPASARSIEVRVPNANLPKVLGLLIRKPARSDTTTLIDEIRFVRQAANLFPSPPVNPKQSAAPAKN